MATDISDLLVQGGIPPGVAKELETALAPVSGVGNSGPASRVRKTGWSAIKFPNNSTPYPTLDQTHQLNIAARASTFFAVKFRFFNHSLTDTLQIKAVAASVPTLNHTGSGVTYTPITIGGVSTLATPGSVPVAVSVAGRTEPSYVDSDVMYIPSTARTDVVGGDAVISVRNYPGATRGQEYVAVDRSNAQVAASTLEFAAGQQAGDRAVVTGQTVTVSTGGTLVVPQIEVQFLQGGAVAPIRLFGDSLSANLDFISLLHKELRLKAPTKPVSVSFNAIGGDKREATSYVIRNSYVANDKTGGVAIIWNYSVNGTGTGFSQNSVLQGDIDDLVSKGIYPVIITMHGGQTGTNAPPQSRYVTTYGSQYTVIDLASLWEGNAGDGAPIVAEYTSDWTHITTAGYAVAAPVVADAILSLMS